MENEESEFLGVKDNAHGELREGKEDIEEVASFLLQREPLTLHEAHTGAMSSSYTYDSYFLDTVDPLTSTSISAFSGAVEPHLSSDGIPHDATKGSSSIPFSLLSGEGMTRKRVTEEDMLGRQWNMNVEPERASPKEVEEYERWRGREHLERGRIEDIPAVRWEVASTARETAITVIDSEKEGKATWETQEETQHLKEHSSLAELYGLEDVSDEDGEEGEENESQGTLEDEEEGESEKGLLKVPHSPLRSTPLASSTRGTESVLAIHRVRDLLHYEGSSSILSKDAVAGVSAAVALILQDLVRTSAEFASRRHRQRVTAREMAHVISLYDRFAFLSDVIPAAEEEKKKKPTSGRPLRNGGTGRSIEKEPVLTIDSWMRSTRDVHNTEDVSRSGEALLGNTSLKVTFDSQPLECHVSSLETGETERDSRSNASQNVSFRDFPVPSRGHQSTLRF